MNPHGNPAFKKGNTLARGNRGGGRRKSEIAHMLEQFAPRVIECIGERLNAGDPAERWACAKELLPYLWGKKAPVAVLQDNDRPPSLAEYLAAKTNGHADTTTPSRTPDPRKITV